jgi:glutathione S-transferase
MSENTFTLYVDRAYVSPYALSAFVALEEKGVPFEMRALDLVAGEHRRGDFRERSPTGRIPALSHGDFHLSESSAIDEYLEDLLPPPHPALYPQHIADRARAREIQAWLRSDLMPIREERPTTVIFKAPSDEPLSGRALAAADRLYAAASQWLGHGALNLFGEWSIADTDLALMIRRLLVNGDAVPDALAHYARHQWLRPSVQRWIALPRG